MTKRLQPVEWHESRDLVHQVATLKKRDPARYLEVMKALEQFLSATLEDLDLRT